MPFPASTWYFKPTKMLLSRIRSRTARLEGAFYDHNDSLIERTEVLIWKIVQNFYFFNRMGSNRQKSLMLVSQLKHMAPLFDMISNIYHLHNHFFQFGLHMWSIKGHPGARKEKNAFDESWEVKSYFTTLNWIFDVV